MGVSECRTINFWVKPMKGASFFQSTFHSSNIYEQNIGETVRNGPPQLSASHSGPNSPFSSSQPDTTD